MRLGRVMTTAATTAALLTAMGCGGDDSAEGSTTQSSTAEAGYICPASSQPAIQGPVQVTALGGCSYHNGLGHVTYGLVVQNTGDETVHRVSVDVDVLDPSGVSAGRAVPHLVYRLEPGQEIGLGYQSVVQGTPEGATLSVQVDVPPDPIEWPDGEMTVSDVVTTVEGSARTTTFTLTSSYEYPRSSVEVFAVYRNAEGQIIGGESDLVENIDAGGTVTHTIPSEYVNPAITEALVFVNDNPEPPR
jgi:hypothetical protein